MDKKTYLTTAIAYANAAPHIGHAFEFVMGDVIARLFDSYFVTGMDEHGQKIQEKAKQANMSPEEFVNGISEKFKSLDKDLGIDYDFFVRTSDEAHKKGAQKLWNAIKEKGDIELREYEALYCIGCEEFKKETDLNEKGECIIHLIKPELVKEKNYFFKLSKYTAEIKERIESGKLEIIPETRKNEILALLNRGLEDVSFSRPKEKVSWGIPVPGDDTQVMYVWCDALSNYITALGYGGDSFNESLWENATHLIGKDILRFHAAIWPGMLLSAGLLLPKRVLVHGFITSGGHKMSKTLGNVIDPQELLEMFRPACGDLAGEALRFVLLHEIPSFEDGDLTMDSIKSTYSSYLVNGFGNLTSRIMKLATTHNVKFSFVEDPNFFYHLNNFDVKAALNGLTHLSSVVDKKIQDTEPFKIIKIDEEKGKEMILDILQNLNGIARTLKIFMPKTSAKILECIRENKMPEKPLFARL